MNTNYPDDDKLGRAIDAGDTLTWTKDNTEVATSEAVYQLMKNGRASKLWNHIRHNATDDVLNACLRAWQAQGERFAIDEILDTLAERYVESWDESMKQEWLANHTD